MSSITAGTTSTTTLVHSGDTTGSLVFKTNDTGSGGTTAVTIDTSQNVGIGVTPSAWTSASVAQLGAKGSVWFYSGGSMHMTLNAYSVAGSEKYIQSDTAADYYQYAGGHFFRTAASGTAGNAISWTTGMTLDSSGNLLVGLTTNSYNSRFTVQSDASAVTPFSINDTSTGATSRFITTWYRGGTSVGNISITNTNTAYNTSSDYRLKENINPMQNALDVVAQLKPVTYKWKVDGSDGEGFIAHELAEVCPHAVTGKKDEVDANGNPIYQGVDVSFLVATLTAAIQEAKALIDTQAETINALTARVVALESKVGV